MLALTHDWRRSLGQSQQSNPSFLDRADRPFSRQVKCASSLPGTHLPVTAAALESISWRQEHASSAQPAALLVGNQGRSSCCCFPAPSKKRLPPLQPATARTRQPSAFTFPPAEPSVHQTHKRLCDGHGAYVLTAPLF